MKKEKKPSEVIKDFIGVLRERKAAITKYVKIVDKCKEDDELIQKRNKEMNLNILKMSKK